MPAGLTSLQVANRALTEISRGTPLTGGTPATNFDGSANGVYCATLYNGAVEMLLRNQDWEFCRTSIVLTLAFGPPTPLPFGWQYEYIYPIDCMRVRHVFNATNYGFDPQSVRWEVGTNGMGGPTVIWTNIATAQLSYSTNLVTEAEWDSMFTETMVRYIGSQLALPVAGRPDFSKEQLQTAGRLGQAGMDKDS
jgi:hypothetical protein